MSATKTNTKAPRRSKKMETQVEKEKLVIVNNFDRTQLTEGRNYGPGFGFVKKVGNELITLGSPSTCREYLNDQVAMEHKGPGSTYTRYGYTANYSGILEAEWLYILLIIMPYKQGHPHETFEKEKNYLLKNHKHVQAFVNYFENWFGFKELTTIEPVGGAYFLMTVPKAWAKTTYFISLHTLLVRVAIEGHYNSDKSPNAWEWLNSGLKTSDAQLFPNILPKIKLIAEGERPTQKEAFMGQTDPHVCGIFNAQFKSFANKSLW